MDFDLSILELTPSAELPDILYQSIAPHLSQIANSSTGLNQTELAVLSMSQFVCTMLINHPEWLRELKNQPPANDEWQHYTDWLNVALMSCQDEESLMRELRLFRNKMMVRIAWMQTQLQCSTEETLCQLSQLAEALIITTQQKIYQWLRQELGTPVNQHNETQPLLILAMGKLGGGELNYSSDVDLIFVYPETGQTQGGRRHIDNHRFFTRLGQKIIKCLDQVTADGFVYRVDMRLRPFGDGGPLVMNFVELENYYQEQGRDWERYAMIKAKVLGYNSSPYLLELQKILQPFVYRRYIDFSIFQSLRNMKQLINQEVRRRSLHNNIKLGAGGIREIEFIVQSFQLIRGGREPRLQCRSLLQTLPILQQIGLLPADQILFLQKSYLFLRRLENLLQAINDKQTQILPDSPLEQARLTWGMGFDHWQQLQDTLQHTMQQVHAIFADLISSNVQDSKDESALSPYVQLWMNRLTLQETTGFMPQLSEHQYHRVITLLVNFRTDSDKKTIGRRGRDVLDQLMPRLLAEVCQRKNADITLERILQLLSNIVSRTTYLELLLEYPSALTQLIKLCEASPMISTQLANYPILLDELLDPRTLYRPITQHAYRDELQHYLLRIANDEEVQVEAIRQFKQSQILRIAASDIGGFLPVMKVSDHLTFLAEAIIETVVQHAWQQMIRRYGQPRHLAQREGKGFAVIAYGKLGGIELGYGSDLDLVFLIDCPADVYTDGERSIHGHQFYLRLTQRILHLFSMRTASGILYEVDARLRPSGDSGLLVSTIEAFADYQHNDAWTWEHQALVRSRMVYGEPSMARQFTQLRQEILCQQRDQQKLQKEVRDMRHRIYQNLSHKRIHHGFDLKNDQGGLTDIEFIAQYLVLQYAWQQPELAKWSDNVRIFESMANYQIMPAEEAQLLTQTYIRLRDEIHHLTLQEQSAIVSADRFQAERQKVKQSWQYWLNDHEENELNLR